MKINRASALWKGSLKKGVGTVQLSSVRKEVMLYTFASRFEDGTGTNPEELIAAAHAACFSMALSGVLSENGFEPKSISTSAEVKIEKSGEGFKISESTLVTNAEIESIDEATFIKLAEEAKVNCPVSKALTSVKIILQANLVQ